MYLLRRKNRVDGFTKVGRSDVSGAFGRTSHVVGGSHHRPASVTSSDPAASAVSSGINCDCAPYLHHVGVQRHHHQAKLCLVQQRHEGQRLQPAGRRLFHQPEDHLLRQRPELLHRCARLTHYLHPGPHLRPPTQWRRRHDARAHEFSGNVFLSGVPSRRPVT